MCIQGNPLKIDISNLRVANILLSGGGIASGNLSAAGGLVASPSVIVTLSPAAQRAQDAQNKKFEDIQNALQRLRSMPSPRILAKREAATRAMRLKARIDMLKQMLIGASPQIAKGIAAQIKSIASELASLAKAGADQPGAETSATSSAGPLASTNPSNAEQTASSAVSDATDTQTKPGTEQAPAAGAQVGEKVQPDGKQLASKGDNGEKDIDEELKKAVEDAKSALKSLIAMLKSMLGGKNKDIEDAEHLLANMDQSNVDVGSQSTSVAGTGDAAVPA